jgi:hypothetical protein
VLRACQDSPSTRHLENIAPIIRVQGNKLDQTQPGIAAAGLGLLRVWKVL